MMPLPSLFAIGTVFAGTFGLVIGSFVNVVVYRVPNGLSVSSPASACPRCGSAIKAYDNVPVLSWLVLRGKCRSCSVAISTRYPLVELATGVFFLVVGLRFLPRHAGAFSTGEMVSSILALVAFLYLAAISISLALIDIDVQRLPDKVVLPAYAVGGVLLLGAKALDGDLAGLFRSLAGAAVVFALYGLLWLVYPKGMGFGDVKLAGVLGLWLASLGWGPLVVGTFAAFLLGGVFSIALLATKRITRKGGIPFGPWMLAGAWVGIFAGPLLWHNYLVALGAA